jgi:hypothetical protein
LMLLADEEPRPARCRRWWCRGCGSRAPLRPPCSGR